VTITASTIKPPARYGRFNRTEANKTTHHPNGELFEKTPSGIPTEETLNTGSSLEHNPYPYSKEVAEKDAWKIDQAPPQRGLFQMAPMEGLSACGRSARLRRLSNRLLMSEVRITACPWRIRSFSPTTMI